MSPFAGLIKEFLILNERRRVLSLRIEPNANSLIGAGLFTQYYHVYIVNTISILSLNMNIAHICIPWHP